jgi:hypothetical protein
VTYRATPISQRDGSKLQFSNCRMASGATGIDYDTLGATVSTGSEMRRRSGDTAGGTTSDDIARAWRSYDQTITVRDGQTFDDLVRDLKAGRLVHIDVWHAAAEGPCLSGSGRYGHTMAIAPEQNASGKWLVADPWCYPARWLWWDEAKLRRGAEVWAQQVRTQATSGHTSLGEAVRYLMDRYRPDRPRFDELDEVAETSGPTTIFYTATDAHTGGSDVAIRAPDSLTSAYTCKVPKGLAFYADAALTDRLGEFSSSRDVRYVGSVVDGVARAIIVNTSQPYDDGKDRPTVVYVKESATDPVEVGMPTDTERDKQWRSWLANDSNAPDKAKGTGGPDMTEEQVVDPVIEDDDGAEDDTEAEGTTPKPDEGGEQ